MFESEKVFKIPEGKIKWKQSLLRGGANISTVSEIMQRIRTTRKNVFFAQP